MAKEFPAKVRIGAIDKISQVMDKITAKFPKMDRAVRRTSTAFKIFSDQSKKMRETLDKIGSKMQAVGRVAAVGITLPVLAATVGSVKAFADYETALIGVGKTTNTSGVELERMGDRFRAMAKEIPIPIEELLMLGQTAAQLGVSGSDNVVKFSEVLGKLARASNVAGEEGAADLARLITVTHGGLENVERFASALVQLGNTSAATEAEILGFATRLAGSTAVFNVSGVQALGMATAMKSVGIEAEAGSSSVQRAMGKINEAISGGGKKLEALAQMTGIPMKELKDRFKTDAAGVLRDFAAGLANIDKNGGDMTKALSYFGLSGVRDVQVIGALAKNVELLDEKMKTATTAFEENVALQREFEAASQTLNNRWQIFKNTVNDLGIAIGAKFKPILVGILDVFIWIAEFLNNNPWALKLTMIFAALAAVVGPILIAFGTFLTILPQMILGFQLLQAAMVAMGIAGGTALLPLLILGAKFIAIGVLIAGLIALVWKFRHAIIDGLITAWDWMLEKIDMVMSKLNPLYILFKKITGKSLVDLQVRKTESGEQAAAIAPQGAALGGLETSEKVNREFIKQTNNARVDINVRAPKSTSIVGESEGGVLNINRGFAGAF